MTRTRSSVLDTATTNERSRARASNDTRQRVIIIGSGVAGLTAALDLAPHHDVVLITKADPSESSTRYAQGGVAVVTSPTDSPASHVADTLVAGAGLSDETPRPCSARADLRRCVSWPPVG